MNAAAIGVLLLIKEAPVRTEGGRFMFERQGLSGSEAVFNENRIRDIPSEVDIGNNTGYLPVS